VPADTIFIQSDIDNIATDAETSSLTAWKTYRVTLNRIDANTADEISWPENWHK